MTSFPSWEELSTLRYMACWHEHQGSGMNIDFNGTADMSLDRLYHMINWIRERRKAEADAIKKKR